MFRVRKAANGFHIFDQFPLDFFCPDNIFLPCRHIQSHAYFVISPHVKSHRSLRGHFHQSVSHGMIPVFHIQYTKFIKCQLDSMYFT